MEWGDEGRPSRDLVQAVRELVLPHPPDAVEIGMMQEEEWV